MPAVNNGLVERQRRSQLKRMRARLPIGCAAIFFRSDRLFADAKRGGFVADGNLARRRSGRRAATADASLHRFAALGALHHHPDAHFDPTVG